MVVGAPDLELGPYMPVVALLAELSGLDEDTLREHALSTVRHRIAEGPSDKMVRRSLDAAGINVFTHRNDLFIIRSVVGRMVCDFRAAGYLEGITTAAERVFRSFDPGLTLHRPEGRPGLAPPAPAAGHEVTLRMWIDGTEQRLSNYLNALNQADGFVIAATSHATVLNWDHPEEWFTCSTIAVHHRPASLHQYGPSCWSTLCSPISPEILTPLTIDSIAG